jgi:signal transduction histidine kinase
VRGLQEQVLAVDIEPVIRAVLQNTRPPWKDLPEEQGHQIRIHIGLLELPPVSASESGLYNVVLNLISNAVDAMPTGGTLTIEGWQ